MAHSRQVEILLPDGRPQGLRVGGLANWDGVVAVSPRSGIDSLMDIPELDRSGVLVLRSRRWRNSARLLIDGAGTPRRRLQDDLRNADWWDEAAVLTNRGRLLDGKEPPFLAASLASKALRVGLATLAPVEETPKLAIHERHRVRVAGYMRELMALLPFLRIDEFTDNRSPVVGPDGSPRTVFVLNVPDVRGIAWAVEEAKGRFTVLRGSSARREWTGTTESNEGPLRRRDELVRDGSLLLAGDHRVFTRDVPFRSISGAAKVVCGAPRSGTENWRCEESGQTYKEWKAARERT